MPAQISQKIDSDLVTQKGMFIQELYRSLRSVAISQDCS